MTFHGLCLRSILLIFEQYPKILSTGISFQRGAGFSVATGEFPLAIFNHQRVYFKGSEAKPVFHNSWGFIPSKKHGIYVLYCPIGVD